MITSLTLLIDFWIGMTALITLILMLISQPARVRVWYLLVLVSFPFWVQPILFQQGSPLPLWFYLIPALWIVGTLGLALPKIDRQSPPLQLGEPKTTIESIRGPAGTSEALRIYFTLVFLASIIGLYFFQIALSSSSY